MYVIYFPYSVALAMLILYECISRQHPKWWAVMVLFAPVTTPYFIFKSGKESRVYLFILFLASFLSMAAGEFYLYTQYMNKNKYADLPPVTREMIRLSENLKDSTLELDHALIKLENMSKVGSRIKEIKETIDYIGELRLVMTDNTDVIERVIKYTEDYKSYFTQKEVSWVFDLQKFYNNRFVIQHQKSLKAYLKAFEDLLNYTFINFYKITDLKSEQQLKNYDEYYLRYRRAVDSHNRFNVKRIDFQNTFIEKHPDTKAYLPGKRQTDTFRLWE